MDRNHAQALNRRAFIASAACAAVGATLGSPDVAGAAEEKSSATAVAASSQADISQPEGSLSSDLTADGAQHYDCDVCVVGCGASGFMAALSAARAGAHILVLEKGEDLTAPNGVYVSGPFAIDTDVLRNKDGGSTLGVDEVFQHLMNYSHWTPNPLLIRRCLEVSKDAVATLEDIGYSFREANFRFETPFINEKGGFHLITTPLEERLRLWQQALEDGGIEVLWSCSMESLLMEDTAVCGVTARSSNGQAIQVHARAVILATGGYVGNRDMQERFLKTRRLNVAKGGKSLCTGDGIAAAERAGAVLDKTVGYCPCEYGGTNSKASRPAMQDKYDQNYAFKFGYYGNLLVDAQGRRFINEGLLCDYPMSYGSEQIVKNAPWYAVVDQAYVDAMATEGLYAYMTRRGATSENWFIGAYYQGRVLDRLAEDIDEALAEGWCWKADTVEELAQIVGLPYLVQTVQEYNGYCERGIDAQFGCNPWYLSPVSTGPFYVMENEPSAWSTFGGIRIDADCQALGADNKPLAGLYAAGTDAGSLFYSPYYDVPGMCYGLCIASGTLAAQSACSYAGIA